MKGNNHLKMDLLQADEKEVGVMIVQTMNGDLEKIEQRYKAAHVLQKHTKNNIITEMMCQTTTQEIENVAQRNTNERKIIVVNEVIAAVVVVVVVAAPTTKRDRHESHRSFSY